MIVPTARAHPLPALMAALDNHLAGCKKKSAGAVAGMIEYILIKVGNALPHSQSITMQISAR